MTYKHTASGEVWDGSHPCTSHTSNFYLLSHAEKVALGWELVAESISPTSVQVLFEQKRDEKLAEISAMASHTILNKYPSYKQINASLGVYSDSVKQDMIVFINSIRAKHDAYKSQALAATTVDELNFSVLFDGN